MILFHGLKMIRLPKEDVNTVKEYVRTNHIKIKDVEGFLTMENKDIFNEKRFFDIVSKIYDIIFLNHKRMEKQKNKIS
jgi:hypothetical protein